MAGGYRRKRAPVSTVDELLAFAFFEFRRATEIVQQVERGFNPLAATPTLPPFEMVRSNSPANLAHGGP